tara:strand:- start:3214 stop:4023 length:810 start_codon:yes stop_codon:yes gene_type:complete
MFCEMENDNQKYYNIVKVRGDDCLVDKNRFVIQNPAVFDGLEVITNDHSFRQNLSSKGFYWLSGGGTFLLNERHILVVRRRRDDGINPYKVSLFTGRADNINELTNPLLLARELFEELLLFSNDFLIYPKNKKYQDIIDNVYETHIDTRHDVDIKKMISTDFSEVKTSGKKIVIGNNEQAVDFFINSNLDVNVLFLFSINLDIDALQYVDGENYIENGKLFFPKREIFLLDIKTMNYKNHEGELINLTKENMTEHLSYFVERINNIGKI